MAKLLDYLKWRGDLPLGYDGFCELDAAVMARLSYVPFELVSEHVRRDGVELKELAVYLTAAPGVRDRVLSPHDLELCRQVSECRRYEGVKVYEYVCRLDVESETQFSAMSFRLDEGKCCVAFRGTDNTLIGWKEDLNMGFTFPVPAQVSAAEYLDKLAQSMDSRHFILCGHSKGGNLAVYAGSFCAEETRRRIVSVYNFDGPGFDMQALEKQGMTLALDDVRTFVPQSSVVGMLFDNDRPYNVVFSEAGGLMQHDIYSWQTRGRSFVGATGLTDASRKLDASLGVWMHGMSTEERAAFVDTVYQILTQNNAKTIDQLSSLKFESAMTTLKTIRNLDEKTRSNALKAVQLLMLSLKSEVLSKDEEEAKTNGS